MWKLAPHSLLLGVDAKEGIQSCGWLRPPNSAAAKSNSTMDLSRIPNEQFIRLSIARFVENGQGFML